MTDFDVGVVGAGVAGLAAARVCAEAGLRVVVLEAFGRVGGRIRTQRVGGEVIELGAEFVHGRSAELWELIEEAGLETYERTRDFLRLDDDGKMVEVEQDEAGVLDGLKGYAGEDAAFAEYVRGLGLAEEEVQAEIGYVEGFNAADARAASIVALGRQQVAEDAIEGDRVWRVKDGYDRVPEFLAERVRAAGGEIVFGARVESVVWERGKVSITTYDRSFTAGRLVLAVPLGVIQGAVIGFEPWPEAWRDAWGGLGMGAVCRFTMAFSRRLWPEGMSFLLTPALMPPVWWTARPAGGLTLTGWVGGPRSAELLGLSEASLRERAVGGVAAALGVEEADVRRALTGFFTLDWNAEDGARGAYSWVRTGGAEASARLALPVEETLFVAGEHTDTTGHWGTVHAALRSGLRAGAQVLEALSDARRSAEAS